MRVYEGAVRLSGPCRATQYIDPEAGAMRPFRVTYRSDDADNELWIKSSSSYANGNCVEVAGLSEDLIKVRDSKHPKGTVLRFAAADWDTFVSGVRNGKFDGRL